jgi:hypothetical protein
MTTDEKLQTRRSLIDRLAMVLGGGFALAAGAGVMLTDESAPRPVVVKKPQPLILITEAFDRWAEEFSAQQKRAIINYNNAEQSGQQLILQEWHTTVENQKKIFRGEQFATLLADYNFVPSQSSNPFFSSYDSVYRPVYSAQDTAIGSVMAQNNLQAQMETAKLFVNLIRSLTTALEPPTRRSLIPGLRSSTG